MRPPRCFGIAVYFKGAAAYTVAAILIVTAGGGCARYSSLPLPDRPDLRASLPVSDAASIRRTIPVLPSYPSDARRPLTMTDVAIFAVMENPQLKAQRLKRGVGEAEIFTAGLLPDPQLALSVAPVVAGPGTETGWSYGFNYDLQSLVIRRAKIAVAEATADKVDLETLWQEWQVVQQARTFFVTLAMSDRKLVLLRQRHKLTQQRFDRSNRALAIHTATIETVGPDLIALLDVKSQIAQLERAREDARIGLSALLGLTPTASVPIARLSSPRPISRETVARGLNSVAIRRPDMLALRAGYEAQEGQLQQAILAQFPTLNIGLSHANDTTGVQSINLGVTLGLPLFNGNRGDIAIQAATREQLRQEYQARIDQTTSDIETLARRQELLDHQISALRKEEPVLADMAKQARAAYANGDVTSLVLLNLESNLLQKQMERLDLEESLWTTRIALEALLGLPEQAATAGDGERL